MIAGLISLEVPWCVLFILVCFLLSTLDMFSIGLRFDMEVCCWRKFRYLLWKHNILQRQSKSRSFYSSKVLLIFGVARFFFSCTMITQVPFYQWAITQMVLLPTSQTSEYDLNPVRDSWLTRWGMVMEYSVGAIANPKRKQV